LAHSQNDAVDPMYGPAVRCKRLWSTLADAVLRPCIRSLIGACAPGHHGYQRASRQAFWVTSVRTRREDRSSIIVSSSRRTRRVRVLITSSIASWLCAVPLFVPGSRSFVPTCGCRGAPRAGTVKVGRRACLASRASVARPRLDGPEHGARIKRVGTRLHWS
jgi:hypothetical protein